jgi:MinD-like ATPase involved in chromosome partitioning or flagellar assembly
VSILALASVKGSPGVTTTACLLGSTWPNADRVVVAECDPSGGDLSARFALSARQGWTSLAASIRRGASGPLGEHLQTLPGGLRVLIGSRDSSPDCARLSRHFLERGREFTDGPWDIVVDVGRIVRGDGTQTSWLAVADRVILVLRTDAGAVIHAKSWADTLPSDLKGRLALVTVGAKGYPNREIEGFTSLSVIGHLPEDREVARAVSGEPATQRRLRRSSLTAATATLAARLFLEADCNDGELRSSADDDLASRSDAEMTSVADDGSRLRFRLGGRLDRPKVLDRVLVRHQAHHWSERVFPMPELPESEGERLDSDPIPRTDPVLRTVR